MFQKADLEPINLALFLLDLNNAKHQRYLKSLKSFCN